jgi:hypothetical protein
VATSSALETGNLTQRPAQFEAPSLLRLWHLTSLDAPTVALVWTFCFAWLAHLRLPFWPPVALALAAWSVYITDRLLDARFAHHKSTASSLQERHNFHWKHRARFLPVAILTAVAAVALDLHYMPYAARVYASFLATAALVYFAAVHSIRLPSRIDSHRFVLARFFLPKELLVAVIFTLACAGPAWVRSNTSTRLASLATIFAFIALAWLNCRAIDAWESTLPPRAPIFLHAILLAAVALAAAAIALRSPRTAAMFFAASISAALLALLDRRRCRFAPTTLRAAADLALLVPAALLVLP